MDQSFWGGDKFSVLYLFLETFLVDHVFRDRDNCG